MFGASVPRLFSVGVAPRAVHATARARRGTCLTRHCGCPFSHDFARPFQFEHVSDSHTRLIFNRTIYRAVAGALAVPERLWGSCIGECSLLFGMYCIGRSPQATVSNAGGVARSIASQLVSRARSSSSTFPPPRTPNKRLATIR